MKFAPLILLLATATAPAALTDQLAQIDKAASQIKDLTAHFEQRKFTSMLVKPLISSGQVRSAGSAVRWDTQQPSQIVLYANRSELRLYYPDQKLEEIYPIDQRLSDLVSSPVPRLTAIKSHFTIEPAQTNDLTDLPSGDGVTLALRLNPIDPGLSAHVRRVIVVLDVNTGLTRAVRTVDPDDDHTDVIFTDAQINTGLTERSLDLAVPADVSVSHPLDSAPPSNHENP